MATEYRASVETTAPTVGEAVERGLARLGLRRDQVEIVVLEEGRPGHMPGMGVPSRVRLTALDPSAAEDPDLEAARTVVQELLARMRVAASTTAEWTVPQDEHEARHALIEIHGQDLGIMVSRRGEALGAMQYLARMMVARKLGRPLPVIVDVEGFRRRREQQLRRMARRAAEQAVERGRTVVLEPMPANERRIIHIELRGHADVTTESVGVGRQRKVTIVPGTGRGPDEGQSG
ncbi:MAG: Jag N-terminal domain-containing protein [Anaerolineales bacterium]|nr:Jag N-terminal domain-containing protein [Anaerolineales bacterium]